MRAHNLMIRPTPYLIVSTREDMIKTIRALHKGGMSWANHSEHDSLSILPLYVNETNSIYLMAQRPNIVFYYEQYHIEQMIEVGHKLVPVNSASHLMSYMRTTDRMHLPHVCAPCPI